MLQKDPRPARASHCAAPLFNCRAFHRTMQPSPAPPALGGSRRPFTIEEDAKLIELVNSVNPSGGSDVIASRMPGRTSRQCRERWVGYLSPAIRFDPWTDAEDQLLLSKITKFGHKWTKIAQDFNGRSGNDVKNRWYSHLKGLTVTSPDGKIEMSRDSGCQKRRRKPRIACPYQAAAAASAPMSPCLRLGQLPELPPLAVSSDWQLPPLLPRPPKH